MLYVCPLLMLLHLYCCRFPLILTCAKTQCVEQMNMSCSLLKNLMHAQILWDLEPEGIICLWCVCQ